MKTIHTLLSASLLVGLPAVSGGALAQEAAEAAVEVHKGDVAWMMTATVLVLFMIVPGLAIGTLAALALGRAVASQLYGVGAADPAVIGAAAGILVAVALAASLVPALQASRASPIDALRAN